MTLAIPAMKCVWPCSVVNIVHGSKSTVNNCAHGDEKDISFLGSNITAGMHMGAKTHLIVMPDASIYPKRNSFLDVEFGACGANMDDPIHGLIGLIIRFYGSRQLRVWKPLG